MAQNDAVDADEDTADRRDRPVVRGEIGRLTARNLAAAMLVGAMIVAMWAGWGPGVNSLLLVVAIGLYNTRAKATVFGPLLMAACRYLNAMLGVAAATVANAAAALDATQFDALVIRSEYAFKGLLLYIIGLTCFARMETGADRRRDLLWGLLISLAGLAVYCLWPLLYTGAPETYVPQVVGSSQWYFIWAIVALIATRGMFAAVLQPTPRNIGRGVGIAIQGLVVIDAVLAALYAGPVAGLAILALLPVTMLLARWIPQT